MDNEYNEIVEELLGEDGVGTENDFDEEYKEEKDYHTDNEEVEFDDVVKELEYQLKFNEFSRKYIKVKIDGKKYKVIPITEFKVSGSFVLQTDDKKVIQAKRKDIQRWRSR